MDNSENNGVEQGRERSAFLRRWRVLIGVGTVASVAFLGVLPLQMCRDYAFVCENTGSHKGYRQWCIGLRTGEWYRESHLEQFMCRRHPSDLMHRWASYQGTGRNILGQSCSFRCGFPQLNTIMQSPPWFDRYVDTLDDAGRLDLYHVLVSGNREAVRAQEKKIEDMALTQFWALGQTRAE